MDEEILSTLAYFQEEIQELSNKFQKLKDITYNLYKENQTLKKENEKLKGLVFDNKREGHATLVKLYNEGYHVCPLSFGEKRKGDCLFCLKLVNNNHKEC